MPEFLPEPMSTLISTLDTDAMPTPAALSTAPDNQLIKQFTQMRKMMKKMKGGGMKKMMRQMEAMRAKGGGGGFPGM